MSPQELAELDLAVARAEGVRLHPEAYWWIRPSDGQYQAGQYHPTSDAAEAMRLLEKYRFSIWPDHQEWRILLVLEEGDVYAVGPTAAIAICRAVVAAQKEKP